MPKIPKESLVAICLGPSNGRIDCLCGEVAFGNTLQEAHDALAQTHIRWSHLGMNDVPVSVVPHHEAILMLNPPRYFDQ